ncbi:MAG: hypothetical protein E6K80_03495 [Candidatus Eisenbacteria bacterium]|uniref:Uncharacterized protein n=1 Tax=Eiseniibacteriota bacterium TaxID=2212470 RepID=A0A538U8G8_UNCEI|nr:MAG: hypothetical protein E6K80_03495 [Candidatus Eisenbacteria bacterium]
MLAADPLAPEIHAEGVRADVPAVLAQQEFALVELLERGRDARLLEIERVLATPQVLHQIVARGVAALVDQLLGQEREDELVVGLQAVPQKDHLRQGIVDDPVDDVGQRLERRLVRAALVQVIHEALADRLRVERLPRGEPPDGLDHARPVIDLALHGLAHQSQRVLAREIADHLVVRTGQEPPVVAAPLLEILRAREHHEHGMVLDEIGQHVEDVRAQETRVDLVLEQLVFVEQEDELLGGKLLQHLADEFLEGGGMRRVRAEHRKRNRLAHFSERGADLLRDPQQELDLVADRHRLHVDQHRDEIRSEAPIEDLEQDRRLAAAALAAEHHEPTDRGVLEVLPHHLELGFAAEEHGPAADRVADDVGIRMDRSEMGWGRPFGHGGQRRARGRRRTESLARGERRVTARGNTCGDGVVKTIVPGNPRRC